MTLSLQGFIYELENYEWGVRRALVSPRDPEESDELRVLLSARDAIERGLRFEEGQFQPHLHRIAELDTELLHRRSTLLAGAPWYLEARERHDYPKSYWWWHLDEVSERQCSYCGKPMEVRLTTLTLAQDGLSPTAGLIVYVCPQCGDKRLPKLSLDILMELLNQVFEPVISQSPLETGERMPVLAVVD